MSNAIDEVFSGGGKSAFSKESPIGTSITGTVIDVSVQQIRDYMTGELKFWDGERPQQQLAIVLQTDLRTDAEDDGKRSIYIKTWGVWKEKLMEAVRAAGGTKLSDVLATGAIFTDTYVHDKPSKQGSPTKVHEYRIQPAQANVDAVLGGTVNTSTGEISPAPAAAPAQPAAPAAPAAAAPAAPDPVELAKQLIGLGIPDNVISTQTGLSDVVVAAMRAQQAA